MGAGYVGQVLGVLLEYEKRSMIMRGLGRGLPPQSRGEISVSFESGWSLPRPWTIWSRISWQGSYSDPPFCLVWIARAPPGLSVMKLWCSTPELAWSPL